MKRFVLWDIDGTLVDSGGCGVDAFADAFADVLGRRPAQLPSMAGRTDPDIALEVFELNGVADGEARLDAFSHALAAALAGKEVEIRARGRALPGAAEAIEALEGHEGVVQSLLTGNIEPNAAVKLGAFGLERRLDFSVGAFGSDHRDRLRLAGVARVKALERRGIDFAGADTVLIGDTPRDVAAARAGGARVVAVATGRYGMDELRATEPDALLPSLEDTAAVIDAVLAPAPSAYAS